MDDLHPNNPHPDCGSPTRSNSPQPPRDNLDPETRRAQNRHIELLCKDAQQTCTKMFLDSLHLPSHLQDHARRTHNAIRARPKGDLRPLLDTMADMSQLNESLLLFYANAVQDGFKVKTWATYLLTLTIGAFPGRLSREELRREQRRLSDGERAARELDIVFDLTAEAEQLMCKAETFLHNLTCFEAEQAELLQYVDMREERVLHSLQVLLDLKINKFFAEVNASLAELNGGHLKLINMVYRHSDVLRVPEMEACP